MRVVSLVNVMMALMELMDYLCLTHVRIRLYVLRYLIVFLYTLDRVWNYLLINLRKDIDECAADACQIISQGNPASCENIPGSFTCTCNSGFSADSLGLCSDDNECENDPCDIANQNPVDCVNLIGSFSCNCHIVRDFNLLLHRDSIFLIVIIRKSKWKVTSKRIRCHSIAQILMNVIFQLHVS